MNFMRFIAALWSGGGGRRTDGRFDHAEIFGHRHRDTCEQALEGRLVLVQQVWSIRVQFGSQSASDGCLRAGATLFGDEPHSGRDWRRFSS